MRDLNFDVVTNVVTEQAANRTRGAGYFRLDDGKTARIRFIGGPNEPHRWDQHWSNQVRRSFACAAPFPKDFPGCTCCVVRPGMKSLGAPTPRISFSVIVDRKMHVRNVPDGDRMRQKWDACAPGPDGKPCYFCTSGDEPVREGKQYWDMAPKHAQVLQETARKLAKGCATCGGRGRVSVTYHMCSNCGEVLHGVPEGAQKVLCPACTNECVPDEVLVCDNGCDDPRRRTITDCWIEVRRIGAGTSTLYSFDPERPSELGEEDALIEPFDFATLKHPKDQDIVAETLGVPSPFAKAPTVTSGTIWDQASRT